MTAASRSTTRTRGRAAFWVLIVVLGVVVIAVTTAPQEKDERPFSPTSTRPSGTKAVVELAEHFGAKVAVPTSWPPGDADVAIMYVDTIPVERERDVRAWVAQGHTLVIADPASSLAPLAKPSTPPGSSSRRTPSERVGRGECDIAAFASLEALIVHDPARYRYDVPDGTASCFGADRRAFAVLQPDGKGQIVSLGDPSSFTNELLADGDNAGLATALLAPRPGIRVGVITAAAFPGEATDTPDDISGAMDRLMTGGPSFLLLQLIVAYFVYAWVRGRRVGKPVLEPQPVLIAGSELVDAVGNLLQRTKDPANAAAVLRADLRRDLAVRLGFGRDASAELLADALAARVGFDRDIALRALRDDLIPNEDELVSLARELEAIREEVLHEHVS